MNKAGGNESRTGWKKTERVAAEDQRKEVREQVIGDILWSCPAGQTELCSKGTVINESESGLCLLTLVPIKVGSVVRILGEDRDAIRDATVIWCRQSSANIFKSGLLLNEL